jgi:hypothetical protein
MIICQYYIGRYEQLLAGADGENYERCPLIWLLCDARIRNADDRWCRISEYYCEESFLWQGETEIKSETGTAFGQSCSDGAV